MTFNKHFWNGTNRAADVVCLLVSPVIFALGVLVACITWSGERLRRLAWLA